MTITPPTKSETMWSKLTSFTWAGLSIFDRCVDATLMFWNRVDAFFGWPESQTRRSEQYWRRVHFYDNVPEDDEIVVWDTLIKKLKAPGKKGDLCVFIPPRTLFVQDDMEAHGYEIQRLLDPDLREAYCSPPYQMEADGRPRHASSTIKKPKAPGKLGMLRIVVPATNSFVEEARYANEYYMQKRAADRLLLQAAKSRLPPATPGELETLLPPTRSLYLDCEDEDERPLSSDQNNENKRSESGGCLTISVPCSSVNQEAQANDVWLDIYSQEASQRKLSKGQADINVIVHALATRSQGNVVYWTNDLSAMPSSFWDQM